MLASAVYNDGSTKRRKPALGNRVSQDVDRAQTPRRRTVLTGWSLATIVKVTVFFWIVCVGATLFQQRKQVVCWRIVGALCAINAYCVMLSIPVWLQQRNKALKKGARGIQLTRGNRVK